MGPASHGGRLYVGEQRSLSEAGWDSYRMRNVGRQAMRQDGGTIHHGCGPARHERETGVQASTRGAPRPGGPVGGAGSRWRLVWDPCAIGGLARRDEPRRIGRTQDA